MHKSGIIDYDRFMIKFLPKYRGIVAKTKTYVKNAFLAADLDGNGLCDVEEFRLICKHIESGTFTEEETLHIFMNEADLIDEGEKCMSFDKFALVCADYNIFTEEKQNIYLNVKNNEDLEK